MDVVLHTCCGPCASACVPRLKSAGHSVTMLFANSNIDTAEEFEKRKGEAEKLAAAEGVSFAALPYDHDEWLREVARGFEDEPECGARCARCFRYNLRKAADFARAHGIGSFTTSLTVSPHKVSPVIFAAGEEVKGDGVEFLRCNFKEKGGYLESVRRAEELGLYRQTYCGCEFSKFRWRISHRDETASTNLDARVGKHGDVFTADYQTAGRGRLDHKWVAPKGKNLLMSVVLDVADLAPEHVATLPLVVGLAVARAVGGEIKWPNDVLLSGRKVAGILCERNDDFVIAGIGVNVLARDWPEDLVSRATSLEQHLRGQSPEHWGQSPKDMGTVPVSETGGQSPKMSIPTVSRVQSAVLRELQRYYGRWHREGFAAVYGEITERDFLKGRTVSVLQTDDDASPVSGTCGGIAEDGTLAVGGVKIYAGEAHVEKID